ncbi:MAG TPA: serine/threonine-protein kinase [Polyangia bacterium]|nr:serine/threonine-protein kinase [Polyangia bacterium]
MRDHNEHLARVGIVLDDAYRLTRLIGEGGMATVYEGLQLSLERRVAVKVMSPALAADREALARFQREAQIASRLAHPHIVQASDFGRTPSGEPYLVMEFLEGEDLERRIARRGPLPLPTVVRIVKQVASALAATHAKGIVHRDLKPANVVLMDVEGDADFVKVVDFGISKMRSASTKLTRTSVMMGTPSYMAPEQASGRSDDVDHRADQWALGCITWEMLAGRRLFNGRDVPAILQQLINDDPPPLAGLVSGVTPELDAVLRRALAKKASDRHPTVTAFARAFATAAAPPGVPAQLTPTPLVVVEAAPRRTEASQRPAATPTELRRDWRWLWLRRRRPPRRIGLVGYTMALGQRAIEGLLPSRRKVPWWRRLRSAKPRPSGSRLRALSLLGLGAVALLGGLWFWRAGTWLTPTSSPTAMATASASAAKPATDVGAGKAITDPTTTARTARTHHASRAPSQR